MPAYEYKVVPAPAKGTKAKGLKTGPERFALSLETLMNELGAQGWDYVRADMLPCDERSGLTGTTTTYMNMLVFRRSSETVVPRQSGAPAVSDFAPPMATKKAAPPVAPAEPVAAPALVASRATPGAEVTPFPVAAAPRTDESQASASDAAAAAAAAALNAYRESQTSPRIGDDEPQR
jgi:hypothetical protein